ncbi:MAG TPA: DUF72 domain-containing protein [Sandaracinaceae bacterium LLY-WYZ-13_1]|nr:DUF72 domain-containing protein [Sandaracinaceae bacterium LLY-WYZ-13_1]
MTDQLELFGEPGPDPALAALAAHVPPHVRFGTSSWTFEGWKGLVYFRRYPSKQAFVRRSLAEYARYPLFSTVGIDRSYWAPLEVDEHRAYAAQLPEGFRACAKVWSEITTRVFPRHERYGERAGQANPRFFDPALLEDAVLAPMREGFAGHVGPLIVEIAPAPGRTDPRRFAEAVERFLGAVPDDLRYAFELREPQLLSERYLDVLRAHPHGSHLFNFHTRMPPIRSQLARPGVLSGDVTVARLMIPPGRSYGELQAAFSPFDRLVAPQPAMREDVLRLIDETAARGSTLHVLANNKAEGSSPLTVRALVSALASRQQ